MKATSAEIAEMQERINEQIADIERMNAEYLAWLADWRRRMAEQGAKRTVIA